MIKYSCNIIAGFIGGSEPVQPNKIQQIALYYLTNQISMAQIGNKNIATSTISNYINLDKIYFKISANINPQKAHGCEFALPENFKLRVFRDK